MSDEKTFTPRQGGEGADGGTSPHNYLHELLAISAKELDDGEFADVTAESILAEGEVRRAQQAMRLTEDQRRLYELMSDISEEAIFAGWINHNEYRLWAMISEPGNSRIFRGTVVTDEQVLEMRRLSKLVDGWIVYIVEDDISYEEWGERFLPMAEWLKVYEDFRQKHSDHFKEYLNS
ncbi:hypothetical protein ABI_45180 [Asticcacaulis biprosthecium C19]|uniref:Uncharacterized protein n=1 Tax=Asticcacaulis biprosthecium C19 TaxID=715226 RepID=F4QTM1_9CAUL|nr:hypothetical protein [Asticcacaulis biprosthecium]EGF89171.1 hypothetical protein ABI_45180 [Asticcacaulis biprosthecium C19]